MLMHKIPTDVYRLQLRGNPAKTRFRLVNININTFTHTKTDRDRLTDRKIDRLNDRTTERI